MPEDEKTGAYEWGVKHSEGIRWCPNEDSARSDMNAMYDYDVAWERGYQDRIRLVRRWVGEIEEIENPNPTTPTEVDKNA